MNIESAVNELNLKQLSELNELLAQKAEKIFKAEWQPKFRATNSKEEFRKVHSEFQEAVGPCYDNLCGVWLMYEADGLRCRTREFGVGVKK